ncbi:CDP-alcohol phosphatidyltransferase family protein [Streptosporangium sp. 'caverna']|uniref:CDP-alcohol phosphatidyltransferase family protein n=1 Tax=Streptosporangium sp. 'caverna' TaxID=2202249 RepID=UPI000D7D71DC|nr:CDP-alcohol phosphatidyltransferase family protein [Streptosporangium sp. 'caverna']AWS40839.1 CDP-alcohol phosphatidyltransferase family protein [Streptosporangium sp. 'caverna']
MHDSHVLPSSETSQTTAVVFATTGAAGLRCADGTLLDRLTDQLATLPVQDVHVITRSGDVTHVPGGTHMIGAEEPAEGSRGIADDLRRIAKVATASTGPVALIAGDLVAHTEALATLLEHPARDTGALVTADGEGAGSLCPPVRIEGGRVVAASTSFHDVEEPNGTFRGALHVGVADLGHLAETAAVLADLAEAGTFGSMGDTEVGDLLLVGLVRSGVPVRAAGLGRLHCERMAEQAGADSAVRRLGEVDEIAARLDAAVKGNDGFFTTYFVSSWSKHLVRLAAQSRLTPNAVTGISVGLAVLAAVWFSVGTRPTQVAGAILLYLSFVLDCVDGQLARYTRAFSPLGAWLDATFDRVKEYAAYVGLALGYAAGLDGYGAGGPDGIWMLAVSAMILQALRHMIDFSYAGARADANRVGAAWARTSSSLSAAADTARRLLPMQPSPGRRPVDAGYAGNTTGMRKAGLSVGGMVVGLSRWLEQISFTRWLKKIIVLPIGERMALIAVTAAFFNARVTFIALLSWGGVAALYTLAGRVGRSLSE